MTALVDDTPALGFGDDAVLGWLSGVLAGVGGIVDATGAVDDGTRIDRISLLEKIKGAAAAAQCAEIVRFARSQVAAQQQAGVDYRRLGRGIGDQVGLATKTGGWRGARRLTVARDLTQELPATFELLARGDISEHVAQLVATETSHLDGDIRRRVDAQLVAAGLAEMTPKQAAGQARRLSYAADPEAATARARNARKDRRVSLRPAPDTMTWFGALLPVEQGVACLAALRRHADTVTAAGDGRTRAQIMADTAVERLTGQTKADDMPVEVNLVMPIDSLLDPESPQPADIPGHGPLPARLANRSSAPLGTAAGGGGCSPPPPAGTVSGRSSAATAPPAGSPAPSPNFSNSATPVTVGSPTATPPSATTTTSSPTGPVAPPATPTAAASANGTTTPGRCPAGTSNCSPTIPTS